MANDVKNSTAKNGATQQPARKPGTSSMRLGELLVRENLISAQQLQRAIEAQRVEGGRLGVHLTKLGLIDEKQLTSFLAKQYRIPAIDIRKLEIEAEIIKLVPREVAERHMVVPVNRSGQTLILAMADPSNIFAIDDVKFITNYNIEAVVASEEAIQEAIEKYYGKVEEEAKTGADISYDDVIGGFSEEEISFGESEEDVNIVDLQRMADDAPVVKLANLILLDAIKKGASDIHIEPYEKEYRVRYRIDGVLYEVMRPPLKLRNALTSRIKIMSNLDIAERRLPQDGRIKLKLGKDKEMDFRVSVLPTLFGEKVVLRLLDKSNLQLDMTKLGFEPEPLKQFKDAIHRPYGMVLVTGPTGSGKTTTLYSALSELNKSTENISTAEDPVEFNFAGINQVQMHEDIGLNFASALRSFLRQDPDIIMVGEIRDFETAEIAIKAALTGHMVLSTLHTNDAPSSISRLLNMGIEPFMVGASVNLILAQRLARRICQDCKIEDSISPQALIDLQVPEERIGTFKPMKGAGCKTCNGTGYKGRVALYEVMTYHDELKELTINGASTAELKSEAIRLGMQTLRAAGINKLIEGMTTVAEVLRNTAPD
ncbi:MAG: type IV-A pilus assembly ATPase PilB [Myxococcota bacterium]